MIPEFQDKPLFNSEVILEKNDQIIGKIPCFFNAPKCSSLQSIAALKIPRASSLWCLLCSDTKFGCQFLPIL